MSITNLPNCCIRIDKPTPSRIIVAAIEVIQPRLGIVDIAPVTEGVHSAQGGGKCPTHAPCFAPRAIGIGNHFRPRAVHQPGHIALGVLEVEIFRAVKVHRQRPNGIIGEVHPIGTPGHFHQLVAQIVVVISGAVDSFRNALDICQPCSYYSKAGLAAR